MINGNISFESKTLKYIYHYLHLLHVNRILVILASHDDVCMYTHIMDNKIRIQGYNYNRTFECMCTVS